MLMQYLSYPELMGSENVREAVPLAAFFALFWSFIIVALLKVKIAWGGILLAVVGALFPAAASSADAANKVVADGKIPTTPKPITLRFRGSVRGLLVYGGILVAIYGIYADRHAIAQGVSARQSESYQPPMPDLSKARQLH